jgi:hypothetical protein
MNGRTQRPFVYGTFRSPRTAITPPPPYVPGEPDIAVEVLREFGTTELIGKIYVKAFVSSTWVPAQWDLVQKSAWYHDYLRFGQHFLFDMDGSGAWQVVHFRTETDDTGPYVAVALRYLAQTPQWVQKQRDHERKR